MKNLKNKTIVLNSKTEKTEFGTIVTLIVQKNGETPKEIRYKQITKKKAMRPSSFAKNGLSIESIRKAGYKVSVYHYRTFYCPDTKHYIFLPKSEIKRDPNLVLMPKGGYARITIVTPNSYDGYEGYTFGWILNSNCSNEDVYCYKKGVTAALDRLDISVAQKILNGVQTV
jgi:hypothetical protein